MRKKYFKYIFFTILLILVNSCTSFEDDYNTLIPENESKIQLIQNKVCLEWGTSKSNVASFMGTTRIIKSSNNYLVYWIEDLQTKIKYKFINGKLIASVLYIGNEYKDELDNNILSEYSYEGEYSDMKILCNKDKNTICLSYLLPNSKVYGFTPIESYEYSILDNISFIYSTPECTYNSAKLNGFISGTETIDGIKTIDLIYGLKPELTDEDTKEVKINYSKTFNFNLTNLNRSTSYFYKYRIKVNDINIYSDVYSFKTDYVAIYQIGDIYPERGTPVGIVWAIEQGGIKGKIVSLDQKSATWSNAKQWISNLGYGWRFPSLSELSILSQTNIVNKINSTLGKYNKNLLGNSYWTNTVYRSGLPGDYVYYFVFVGDAMGYSSGYSGPRGESQSSGTIAVKSF